MKELKGKTVLITGAAGGIGRASALAFAAEGCDLVICDIDKKGAEETARMVKNLGRRALALAVDVSDEKQVKRAAASCAKEFGSVDIVFCNAGIGWTGPTHLMERADWDRVLGINFYGVVHFIRHFVPAMTKRRSGHVIITSSIFGITGIPFGTLYASSKAALIGLGECLRSELRPLNIGVTTVCPGLVSTGLIGATHFKNVDEQARALSGQIKPMPAERCARLIVTAVKKDRGVTVITWQAKILWLMKRFSQRIYERFSLRIADSTREFIRY